MKIGVFDSGLGGLLILKAIRKMLPEYDFVYLGDTKRVPYGNRTPEVVYEWTRQAVEYLFKQNCALVILACNTASVQALRQLQQEYLPKYYPNRRVLGVVIPTIETALDARAKNIGVIGTRVTIASHVYKKELRKKSKRTSITELATPLLVPVIEENETKLIKLLIAHYLPSLLKQRIDSLILGCTHYIHLKHQIRKFVGPNVQVISQDDIIPAKLAQYLQRHPEIDKKLSRRGTIQLLLTELTPVYRKLVKEWFGQGKPKVIQL
jgi:glutamate racemase